MRNSWIIANKSVGNRSANTCYQCFTRSLIFIVPRFDFVQWFGKQNLTSNSSSIHFSFGKFNVELGRQTGKILWIGYIEKNIILDSGKSWLIYRLATSFMMMNRALTSKSATSTLSLRNLNRKNIHAMFPSIQWRTANLGGIVTMSIGCLSGNCILLWAWSD